MVNIKGKIPFNHAPVYNTPQIFHKWNTNKYAALTFTFYTFLDCEHYSRVHGTFWYIQINKSTNISE